MSGTMNDVELAALTALVNAYVAETNAANADRADRGEAMAYDGMAGPRVMQTLEAELKLRGILPQNA